MTPVEQWIANNILQIITVFILGGVTIVYLRSQVKSIANEAKEAKIRADEMDKKIKQHSESEWPHGICRAHAELLGAVKEGVDLLNVKTDKTNELLIEVIRNKKA
jgi:hypothetical protein